jgi:hypothetical protein
LRRTEHKREYEFGKYQEKEVLAKEVWPPSSPDCNTLDFSVWGIPELKVNAAACNNIEDLNKKMKEVMGFFDRDIMARTCRRFLLLDRGHRCRLRQFNKICEFPIPFSVKFFLLQ